MQLMSYLVRYLELVSKGIVKAEDKSDNLPP